jgi:hypothetical protein
MNTNSGTVKSKCTAGSPESFIIWRKFISYVYINELGVENSQGVLDVVVNVLHFAR